MKCDEIPPISTKNCNSGEIQPRRIPREGLLIKRNSFSTFPEAHPNARLRSFRWFSRGIGKSTMETWNSPFSLRFHKNSFFRHPKQVESIILDKLFLAQIHASRRGGQKVAETPKSTKKYGNSWKPPYFSEIMVKWGISPWKRKMRAVGDFPS